MFKLSSLKLSVLKLSVLKQRVITALALVALLLSALFADSLIYWRAFISLAVLLGFWEWLSMCKITRLPIKVIASLLFVVVSYTVQSGLMPMTLFVSLMCLLWLFIIWFTVSDHLDFLHNRALKLALGMLLLSVGGWFIIELKNIDAGAYWVLCFMLSVWAADVGAYFVGRRFGKTKLSPTVSPGKTWEGFAGGLGLVAVVFVPLLFSFFTIHAASLLLLTVLFTAGVSVFGDLFESKLKRYADLKDSSQLLPGHGGVLDRIDSLLAGAPFFVMGLLYLGYI